MARRCSICTHPDRAKIDMRLISGESIAQIARDIAGISEDALSRHLKNHLKTDMNAVRQAKAQAREVALVEIKQREIKTIASTEVSGLIARLEAAENYFDLIREIRRKAAELLEEASDAGDIRAAAPLLKELREQIRLMAHIENRMAGEPKINPFQENASSIYDSQEWLKVGDVLQEALDPFPEAKTAAAIALMDLVRRDGI
jgi:hypothetical protein